uniref:Uncharacterized protein n=1 Tax=viral metagenome TaxID=1070528 RepID=A0A6C0B8W6_9ZZZZ
MQNNNNCDFCHSTMFRTSYGSASQARIMPKNGLGIVNFKNVNPYTNITTNKIGTTSGNDTSISKAMRYSQYVNSPNRGGKNTQTYNKKQYEERFGPLLNQTIDKSCYTTPPFKPQVMRSSNNQKIAPGQQFMFQTNYGQ